MRNELGLEVPLKSDELDINIETQGCATPGVGKKSDAYFNQSLLPKKSKNGATPTLNLLNLYL